MAEDDGISGVLGKPGAAVNEGWSRGVKLGAVLERRYPKSALLPSVQPLALPSPWFLISF